MDYWCATCRTAQATLPRWSLQCAKMHDLIFTGSVVEGTHVHSIPVLLVVVVVLFSWVS